MPFSVNKVIARSVILSLTVVILTAAAFQRNSLWISPLAIWRDTAAKSPGKSRPFNSLGFAYATQGLYDEAIECFQKAIANASGPQEIHHYNLANAYMAKGRVQEAVDEYREAIRINADYADAHYRLGLAYKDLGMAEMAEAQLKAAVAYAADRYELHNDLGNIYLLQKKYSQAAAEYRKSLELNPSNVDALYNLALSYDKQRMWGAALTYYKYFVLAAPADYRQVVEKVKERQSFLMRMTTQSNNN